jgi:hypothetical protein
MLLQQVTIEISGKTKQKQVVRQGNSQSPAQSAGLFRAFGLASIYPALYP